MLTDRGFDRLFIDPVHANMLDQSKSSFVRFMKGRQVVNPALEAAFEHRRLELAARDAPTDQVFGFLALPNGEGGEVSGGKGAEPGLQEEDLCSLGVKSGISFLGELGDASKGEVGWVLNFG